MAKEPQISVQVPASKSTTKENDVPFYQLPTELVLQVLSLLPSYSCASLALCSRRLYSSLSESLSAPDLQLPREQPRNFQESTMSNPKIYRPRRWTFLCLLQKDLNDWRICSTCFKLHPIARFTQEELEKEPDERSCSIKKSAKVFGGSSTQACGVVDVCPCIKLTRYGRTKLEHAILRHMDDLMEDPVEKDQYAAHDTPFRDPPTADWFGHTCRYQYGDIVLKIQARAWIDQRFGLRISTHYRCICPLVSTSEIPRLCCPHRHLNLWVKQLASCRSTHLDQPSCRRCYDWQSCRYCDTVVYGLEKKVHTSGQTILNEYKFWTERNLDDSHWNSQIIFPFSTHHKKVSHHHLLFARDNFLDHFPRCSVFNEN